ncbi:DNA polymerase delta subunit 3 [Entamoeba marina]
MSDIQNFINTSVKAENGVVTYMDLLLKYPELNMVKAQQYDIFCLLIISLIPRELNQYHQNNPQFNTLKVSVEKGENSTRIVDGGDCYLVANGDYENALGLSFERYLKTTIPKYIQSQEVAITTEHVFQSDVKAENERKVKLQQLSSSNDKTTNSFDKDHNNDDLKQSITDVIKTTTFVDENKSKSPQQPSSNDEGVKK